MFCCSTSGLKILKLKDKILPLALYGCGIWPLILREVHRLKVSESRELKRISGLKRAEVTGR
jgi:hypothetical protein